MTPFRLIDTRGESPDAVVSGSGVPVGPGQQLRLRVTGAGPIPARGVSAVSLNVAVTGSTAAGYVSVTPCGPTLLTASVNYAAGATASNGVLSPVSVDGEICVRAFTDVHVIVDVNGWFDTRARFRSVTPRRLLDTRPGESPDALRHVSSGRIGGDRVLEVQVTGLPGVVPATDVGAVSLNVAATNTADDGYLTIYPCGRRPLAANLNYRRGQTVSNAVVAPVSADGRLCIASSADTDVVVDVNGWFTGVGFTPVGPARLFDTRGESSDVQRTVPVGQVGGDRVLEVQVTDLPGLVPATGVAAVALNVAVTGSRSAGYVTVYPCGERPFVASLNHAAGATVSNAVIAPVSATGTICVAASVATDVVVDLAGWFVATSPA